MDDPEHVIRAQDRPRDHAIAALADRQHNVVARRQLRALGYSRRAIQCRLDAGRLFAIFRGVYSVGTRRLSVRGRWMAAVLACGPEAVLSHRDAVALHGLRRAGSRRPSVHVTVPGRRKAGQAGILIHNVRHLHPDDRTVSEGIPVTSVHRTLLDYAETASPYELRCAFEQYDRMDLLDLRKLDAVIARNAGRHGIKPLRKLIAGYCGAPETRSENERRMSALLRAAGLPEPSVNVVIEGIVVDFVWPRYKLVLEVDSYAFHHTPADRAKDRRNERTVRAGGYEVLRVLDTEIRDEPDAVTGQVARGMRASQTR